MEPDNLWLLLSMIRSPFDNVRFRLLLHSWVEIECVSVLSTNVYNRPGLMQTVWRVCQCAAEYVCMYERALISQYLFMNRGASIKSACEWSRARPVASSSCMWRQLIVLNKFSVRFVTSFKIQFIRSHRLFDFGCAYLFRLEKTCPLAAI